MNIPGYRLISKLGQGGMASVYLALQESLDREVALKIMDPGMAADESFCDRFLKEGKIVAQLSSHPDIVTVYDIGRADDYYYMAMEYIPGPNLKERIDNDDNPQQPLLVIRQVASALQMAHSRGFIHRDVKPANILFKESGDAVLSDFGIAKAVQAETQLTAIGYAVGTPEYMSPEQAMGQPVDFRADLYCLGVVLYEMLMQTKPYVGQDPFSTALMHINNPLPVFPEHLSEHQPMLNRLMAKNRDERYQSAADVIDEIDNKLGATQVAVAVEEARRVAVDEKPKIGTGAISAIAAIVVGLGVLAFFYFQPLGNDAIQAAIPVSTKIVARSLSDEEQQKVNRLLTVGEAHMAIGRLIEPPGSNARETFQMVLEIDPTNNIASKAIAQIEQ